MQRFREFLTRHRTNVDVLVPVVASVATGVLTAWVMARFVIVNYDSIYYLSSAENLANGLGMTNYTGLGTTNFPPGYSLLIRFVMLFGPDSVASARVLAVMSSVAIVALTAFIAHRLGPKGSAAIAALLTSTVPAFLGMNVQIMSESLFAVAFLVVIIGVIRLPDPPQRLTVRNLAPVILASWVCCLLRYQGYAVVAATAVVLLLRSDTARERLRSTSVYTAGAGAMIVAIVIQSKIRTGSLGAPITPPRDSFVADVRSAFGFAGRWVDYGPSWLSALSPQLAGLFTVALGAAVLVLIVWRFHTPLQLRMAQSFLVYAAALIGVTFVSARRVWVEISPRMAFALLPLVVILVAVFLAEALTMSKVRLRTGAALALVALLVIGGVQTFSGATSVRAATRGVASTEQQAPLLGQVVAELPDDALVYSNNPEGIWYSSRRPVVIKLSTWTTLVINLTSPTRSSRTPPQVERQLFVFRDHLCHGFYLAWTNWQHESRPANSRENLDWFADLTPIETVADGELYFVQSSDERICAEAKEVTS